MKKKLSVEGNMVRRKEGGKQYCCAMDIKNRGMLMTKWIQTV